MICPNCGNQIEKAGKFCAECGAQLPQAAPPPPPPPPAAEVPPPPPAAEVPPPPAPAWAATPPPPPPPGATPAAPQWGQTPPPPGAYYAAPPGAAAGGSAGGMGALLALIGGAVAIGSAWLPWLVVGDMSKAGIDATTSDLGLANGNYLIAAGAVTAACGLLMVLGLARSPGMKQLLTLGAIAGAIGVCVVEAAAYMKMNEYVTNIGSFANVSIGFGIYVGAAGGVIAGLGGLLALTAKPGAAGAPVASNTLLPIVAVIAVVAIVGGVVAWPQISKQINGGKSSPTIGLVTPRPTAAPTAVPTGKPTKTPSAKPSTAPTPAGSFYTSGYSTPELAINQFVSDQGYSYGGDCSTASSGSDYCSSHVSDGSSGSVYAIGGLGSEAEVWALMRHIGGKWYVADVAKATASPPWS